MLHAASASTSKAWHFTEGEVLPFRGGVPLSDRGFRYGQHVFESIAIRHGAALLIADHLSLLSLSASQQGIPCSRTLLTKLRGFLKSVSLADGMIRIYLTAGPGAPGSRITTPSCYLNWEPVKFPESADVEHGISLNINPKPFLGECWGSKNGNYLPHIQALQAARACGVTEGIICNREGRILSCSMGNLLVWMPATEKGKAPILCIPRTGDKARSGAVLRWVLRQTFVIERELRPADIRRATALALTNSRLGVMPVATLDGKMLADPSPSLKLAQEYLSEML